MVRLVAPGSASRDSGPSRDGGPRGDGGPSGDGGPELLPLHKGPISWVGLSSLASIGRQECARAFYPLQNSGCGLEPLATKNRVPLQPHPPVAGADLGSFNNSS